MADDLIDLRWWLLSNLAGIKSLQFIYSLFVIITFSFFILLSLSPYILEENRTSKIRTILLSNSLFVVSLTLFIVAARWPVLLARFLNPDEALFAAGAMTLLRDPVFWRSVDGGSTGPLNIYPLVLPAFFGLRIEYASGRMIGLIFIIITITSLYYALCCLYNKTISRIAIVPVVTTVALMTFTGLVHYSSEHLSIAILSVALLIVCRTFESNSDNSKCLIFSLGFLLGLIPYAKMQTAPIGGSITCIFLHFLWTRSKTRGQFIRSLYPFVLGGLLFSILVMLSLTFFSLFDSFWKSYIQFNLLFYSKNSLHGAEAVLGLRQLEAFVRLIIIGTKDTRFLFIPAEIIVLVGIPLLVIKRGSLSPNKVQSDTFIFVYYTLVFFAVSLYAIVKPGNVFHHYLLFLIVPSGFLIGVFLGEFEKVLLSSQKLSVQKFKVSHLAAGIITASSFLQCVTGVAAENKYISKRQFLLDNYISLDTGTILRHASSGDSMAVWGWASELYVESALVQATRDGNTGTQILSSPLQGYFIKRYTEDLIKSKPRLFIDAVAPRMFFFNDKKTQGHEVFPEIANIIKQDYKLADEIQGVRIYTRNPEIFPKDR